MQTLLHRDGPFAQYKKFFISAILHNPVTTKGKVVDKLLLANLMDSTKTDPHEAYFSK